MVKNSVYFIVTMTFMVLSFSSCSPQEQIVPQQVEETQSIDEQEQAKALEDKIVAKLKAEMGENSNARVQGIVSGHYILTASTAGIANYTKYFPSNKRIDFGISAINPASNNGSYITKAGFTVISENALEFQFKQKLQ